MADIGELSRPLDPDNVPVRIVNGFCQSGILGGLVSLTLATDRVNADADGKVKSEMIVAARLRFDVELARALRDFLNTQIELLTPAPKDKAN